MSAVPATRAKGNKIAKRVASARAKAQSKREAKAKLSLVYSRGRQHETRGLTDKQREALVLKYRMKARKLARSILRKWHARLDLQEVDSVVDLSLCEAVRRFDPSKGASFMTFLFYHLRGNLIRAVTYAATANLVPMGDALHDDKEQRVEDGTAGSFATADEVAQALSGQEYLSPDEALAKKQMGELSRQACDHLDPLEREVIERIFMHEEQLMDIASSLGYSRCHISRVKKKALETLGSSLAAFLDLGSSTVEFEVAPRRRQAQRRRQLAQPVSSTQPLVLAAAGA